MEELNLTPEQEAALADLETAMGAYGEAMQACENVGLPAMQAMMIVAKKQGQEIPSYLEALL